MYFLEFRSRARPTLATAPLPNNSELHDLLLYQHVTRAGEPVGQARLTPLESFRPRRQCSQGRGTTHKRDSKSTTIPSMSMKRGEEEVPMASACAVVPTKEELETVPNSSVELHCPAANSVSPEFLHIIPEARDLTWRDDFFEDEQNVVAVFDFDYDSMEHHYRALG